MKIDKDYRPRAMEFITISLDDVNDIKTGAEVSRSMKATMPAYLLNVSDPEPPLILSTQDGKAACPRRFFTTKKARWFTSIGRIKEPELRDAIEKVIKKDLKPPTGQ